MTRPSTAAPVLSAIGLLAVALGTLALFTGRIPVVSGGVGIGGGGAGGDAPAPSNEVYVDPRTKVPGSIVYAKAGNIWIQSGDRATQLTDSGSAAQPSWSADGEWIYYVETKTTRGLYPYGGTPTYYDLETPVVIRIHPDGSGREAVASGRISRSNGRYRWFAWIRQPVPDPTGASLAVVSDFPEPTKSDVVLQLIDLETGKMRSLGLPENAPLGHQDPAWRPGSGPQPLLYVMNGRDGTRAAPSIWRWDPKTKRAKALTGPGYLEPAWSPNARWIVATRQGSIGTDLVLLDASTGGEVRRLTNDGHAWAATWSPAGDAIAFLHVDHGLVDLRMIRVSEAGGDLIVGDVLDLTLRSGLDPASRPSWWIPADQLPAATPAPTPVVPSPSGGSGNP